MAVITNGASRLLYIIDVQNENFIKISISFIIFNI